MSQALTFAGRAVTCDAHTWEAEYPVVAARLVAGNVCLILDYMEFPRHRQSQNLRGFTVEGRPLWTAQHPTNETADCYTEFVDEPGLVAWNFAGYKCTLDPATGKLIEALFTK